MEAYRRIKSKTTRMREDGVFCINLNRYNTIDQLSEKFGINRSRLEAMLASHQDEAWVVYVPRGENMQPYFQSSEVRTLLETTGIIKKTFANRERRSRWEIKERKGSRPLTNSDLTTIVDGEFYGRAEYWANNLDLQPGRISLLLDELDTTDYASQIREVSSTGPRSMKRQNRIRYFTKNVMQQVANRYDTAKVLDTSIPLPEDANKEEYRSANFWKYSIIQENLSRSETQKIGWKFYKKLREMPSYIKDIEGVKIRVYQRDDAMKAMNYAVRKLEEK